MRTGRWLQNISVMAIMVGLFRVRMWLPERGERPPKPPISPMAFDQVTPRSASRNRLAVIQVLADFGAEQD